MSRFTKTFKFTLEFDGDTIEVTARRLQQKHFAALTPFIKSDGEEKDKAVKVQMKEGVEMLGVAAQILPDCIVEFSGLKAADGTALTLADIVHEVYFMRILSNMLNRLMAESFLKEDDAKKSSAPLQG